MADITEFRKAVGLSPTQNRVEAIVKTAAELGMGGFALAKLRTAATEQIEGARDDARQQAGRCIVQVADGLLHDPKSDGVDGHVSAVLREIGTKLTELTTRQLEDDAMAAILTTQDNDPVHTPTP